MEQYIQAVFSIIKFPAMCLDHTKFIMRSDLHGQQFIIGKDLLAIESVLDLI